ncbi:unnamed protein product [Caenorhabditis angaria]|uniref:BPTI/Kunitz inhibitor domain-containing protein n=1 Tax=Caenorhabditis angaria TaxID=860376 RepID=A0A9P1N114_9PELO|nr:unnamed protein product [Caenorhabditis angaria]
MLLILLLLTPLATILAQDPIAIDCSAPVDLGTSKSCKAKPSLKYHYDPKTKTCLAFLYTGCGGNANRFDHEGACYQWCAGMDNFSCPLGSSSVASKEMCYEDSHCGTNNYCLNGHPINICCEKKWREKSDKEYNPKCPAGKKAFKPTDGGIASLRLGKSCKSNHCPEKATCVQGEFFAACCV